MRIYLYFIALFLLLSLIYSPSFLNPPRSDYWTVFYFFHNLEKLPGQLKWLHILRFDPWTQIRFQPLAYLLLYFKYLLFSPNFFYYHLLNFIIYYISLLLLYKLAVSFCKDKILVVGFITILAFLFSHFDIVSWTLHFYIIFGFSSFLLGFIIYIKYLQSKKNVLLSLVGLSFLIGMLCYEPYFFWPLGLFILTSGVTNKNSLFRKREKLGICLAVVGVVYTFYILIFLFSRTIHTYDRSLLSIDEILSLDRSISVLGVVLFNILYNGILVNAFPLIATPTRVIPESGNINLGGFLISYFTQMGDRAIENIAILGAVLLLLIILFIFWRLWKKGDFEKVRILTFYIFLMTSQLFILFYFRTFTNTFVFSLSQFRYQYISNAFVILALLLVIDGFIGKSGRRKAILFVILSMSLVPNIYLVYTHNLFINKEMRPLRKMLLNIKAGIKNGQISSRYRLYIDDELPKKLPLLCWNREMGKLFMKGTYQWLFPKENINYFAFQKGQATWTLNGELDIVRVKNDLSDN